MYSEIRNGQSVAPYCLECGCRLEVLEYTWGSVLTHFYGGPFTDARGHPCPDRHKSWYKEKSE